MFLTWGVSLVVGLVVFVMVIFIIEPTYRTGASEDVLTNKTTITTSSQRPRTTTALVAMHTAHKLLLEARDKMTQRCAEKPFNESADQPGGLAVPTTVVSGLFSLSKSKHSAVQYERYMKWFTELHDMPMIFFADCPVIDYLAEMRPDAIAIHGGVTMANRAELLANAVPLSVMRDRCRGRPDPSPLPKVTFDFTHPGMIVVYCVFTSQDLASDALLSALWRPMHKLDPERRIHSPELYAVWASKVEMVCRAMCELNNPYGSEYFAWHDAGVIRDVAHKRHFENFPNANTTRLLKRTKGRVTFQEAQRLPDKLADYARGGTSYPPHSLLHYTSRKQGLKIPELHLAGGYFAGDARALLSFHYSYIDKLWELRQRGWFVGKDQDVFTAMAVERDSPRPLALLNPMPKCPDVWRALPAILSGQQEYILDQRFEF